MKTVVRNIALAVAVMGLTVTCHNNKPAEEVIDSTPVEEVVAETVEEAPVEVAEAVEEAPVTEAKKEEPKPNTVIKVDEKGATMTTGKGTAVEIKAGENTTITTDGKSGKMTVGKK